MRKTGTAIVVLLVEGWGAGGRQRRLFGKGETKQLTHTCRARGKQLPYAHTRTQDTVIVNPRRLEHLAQNKLIALPPIVMRTRGERQHIWLRRARLRRGGLYFRGICTIGALKGLLIVRACARGWSGVCRRCRRRRTHARSH